MPSFGLLYMGKLCVFLWVDQNTPIWPVLDLSSPENASLVRPVLDPCW
jgi:hypothetical protein